MSISLESGPRKRTGETSCPWTAGCGETAGSGEFWLEEAVLDEIDAAHDERGGVVTGVQDDGVFGGQQDEGGDQLSVAVQLDHVAGFDSLIAECAHWGFLLEDP